MLEFRILGPLEVVGGEGPIPLRAPKQRATLAILILSANRVVSVDRLADDLYAGATPVTAVTQVQRQISELRRELRAPSVIETRAPGYVLHLAAEHLDLARFERLSERAGTALGRGDHERAADLLREALQLWRGPPLADLSHEPFARTAVQRLEEIRLAAIEQRIEADLALGRHARLVGELQELVTEHPLRERFHAQLMLALYRSGRQAEALDVYRKTRERLVEQFGIEPTPALRELERAILTQDSAIGVQESVSPRARRAVEPARTVLVVPSQDDRLDALLRIAEPLAQRPSGDLIVARLVRDDAELGRVASGLNARRESLRIATRTAAFTTLDPAGDVARLAAAHDVELVLLDAASEIGADRLPAELTALLERSPADVALLVGSAGEPVSGAGVFVPFGGGENDWAALQIAAWLAASSGAPLHLVGTRADPRRSGRDASRLLADAGLSVQRVVGVETRPILTEATGDALAAAVEPASLVVAGISPRWRREGIGAARRALLRCARPSILFVHRGARPSGLAPHGSRTKFSWSIEARAS